MDIQNQETAIHSEQQSNEINNTLILSNIESYLKSIADSLDKISKYGIETYQSQTFTINT